MAVLYGTAYGAHEPIHVGLTLITAPTTEPITIAEAKRHLRIDVDDENADIALWIKAARRKVEQDTGRALLSQTWDLTLDAFPCNRQAIRLPLAPLQSVTSVKSYDSTNTLQILATTQYEVDTSSIPARIGLKDDGDWPTDLRDFQPGIVRIVAGYTTAALVPAELVHAAKLAIGWFAEKREPTKQELGSYEWLIDDYIVYALH